MPDITTQTADGMKHRFPDGTPRDVIDKAMKAYSLKIKGAAPAQPLNAPKPAKTEPAAPSVPAAQAQASKEHESYFTELSKASEQLGGQISRYRPSWEDPQKMLQEPKWYQPNPAASAMLTGAGRAVAGGAVGGVKMLSDLMSSLDPREMYEPTGKAQQVGKDIAGVAYGIGQMSKDLLLHFKETAQDPDKFGQDLMNMAMTVDGGLKGAKAVAEHVFPDNPAMLQEQMAKTGKATSNSQAALVSAYKAQQSKIAGHLGWEAVKSQYLHKNGVGIAKDMVKADAEAQKAVAADVANLGNIPKTEGIDGYTLAKKIEDAHIAKVKTPDPLNPVLNDLLASANNVAPGKMTFEEARQFRSKVGAALKNAKGANIAVLSEVYGSLTKDLKGLATKYGLEDSWNHYNELEMKRHTSFPLLEKAKQVVGENGEGVGMAQALKNEAATRETIKSLSKYGLDANKTLKYMRKSDKFLREGPESEKNLRQYIYSTRASSLGGAAGMLGAYGIARSAGATGLDAYLPALGVGGLTGWATQYLVNTIRASRLAPEILDGITDSREWPGRIKQPKGKFPATTTSGTPAPQLPEAPAPKPTETTAQAATMPVAEAPKPVKGGKSITNKAKAAQVRAEAKAVEVKPSTEPQVTKVPEGEHGTGKVAEQAKARERVARVRKVKGSTAYGGGKQEITGGGAAEEELKKADARVKAPDIDVSKIDAVDLERKLQGLDPKKFKEAIYIRKKYQMSSEEYTAVLQFFYTEAMEKGLNESEK